MNTIAKIFSKVREPANAYTHLAGVLLSILGLVLLLHRSVMYGHPVHVISFTIFGSSMILLYLASTLYHMLPLSDRGIRFMRRIDHIMIYVMIAGTYTPITLIVLEGYLGWALFTIIWAVAVLGILFKLVWFNAPKWISLLIYLSMGWLALAVFPALWDVFSLSAILWIFLGGLAYTIGAVIYGFKWPNPSPVHFNFHAIWHIMVMIGSFCFFWLMYQYVVYY
ncbi:hemolysin III family protein [Natronogracilivirgula saccharolytica]|uniref:Hemolysin III family protein n=1 Tax=Natronogracilivirga saccharolytica TaxID=2812953 RepID=A0A8J7RK33_9BACT|nr:hemolysin III family protein [Natronogracilivirga saccharolytica]MBP3191598.1 hemolysin III family protein [Natronogracilivirga saccharolytica]